MVPEGLVRVWDADWNLVWLGWTTGEPFRNALLDLDTDLMNVTIDHGNSRWLGTVTPTVYGGLDWQDHSDWLHKVTVWCNPFMTEVVTGEAEVVIDWLYPDTVFAAMRRWQRNATA